MDREFFVNGIFPLPFQFDSELHCYSDYLFLNTHLDSAISNSPMSNDTLTVIGGSTSNNTTYTSSYETPLTSPSNSNLPNMDHFFVKENLPNLPFSNPTLPAVSADPGFAERAEKFSCFGSPNFNGGMSQFELNSSSPSLKVVGYPMGVEDNNNFAQNQIQMRSDNNFTKISASNKDSPVSEHIPNEETGLTTPTDSNSRKRKVVSRRKSKDIAQSHLANANATKAAEMEDDFNSKRSKMADGNVSGGAKAEESSDSAGGNKRKKQAKKSPKPAQPPKDYIHVRARRGQATDSHSLAERARREKISERMKLLQEIVPGCNNVTGKTLMLEEIINYVQSLQCQVMFLSMKLASVNLRMDTDTDSLLPKDIFQPNGSSTQPIIYPLGYGHQQPQQSRPQVHTSVSNGAVTQCLMYPLDTTLCHSIGLQFPSVDEFGQRFPQVPAFSENGVRNIFEMGFGQDQNNDDRAFHFQSFPGSNQASHEN